MLKINGIICVVCDVCVTIKIKIMNCTRGIRNNNPLNIRRASYEWKGERSVKTDPAFTEFTTMEYGLRAGFMLIRTYMLRYHLKTIRLIISRWAPPSENRTDRYIERVVKSSGIGPDEPLSIYNEEQMIALVAAMCEVECGQPIERGLIEDAYEMFVNDL